MKSIIGIIGRPYIRENQMRVIGASEAIRNCVIDNGGIPLVILPPQSVFYVDTKGSEIKPLTEDEKNDLIRLIKQCDGIILQGGNRSYEYDYFVADYLIKHNIPTLGICMGMQVLVNTNNKTYYGGSNELNNTKIDHNQGDKEYVHKVSIINDTYLSTIIKDKEIEVNSMHKYHINKVTDFKVSAYSEDGLIEAVEYPGKKFIVGVQWHPEKNYKTDLNSKEIIKRFIEVSKCQ